MSLALGRFAGSALPKLTITIWSAPCSLRMNRRLARDRPHPPLWFRSARDEVSHLQERCPVGQSRDAFLQRTLPPYRSRQLGSREIRDLDACPAGGSAQAARRRR